MEAGEEEEEQKKEMEEGDVIELVVNRNERMRD